MNVARVIVALGGSSEARLSQRGPNGRPDRLLGAWLRRNGDSHLRQHPDQSRRLRARTGLEYRFVAEGPEVTDAEWRRCLAAVADLDFDWLVASGSLPRSVSSGAYAEFAALAAARGARFVLDTSGPPLAEAVAAGGIHLLKPSQGELAALVGQPARHPRRTEAAARDLAPAASASWR